MADTRIILGEIDKLRDKQHEMSNSAQVSQLRVATEIHKIDTEVQLVKQAVTQMVESQRSRDMKLIGWIGIMVPVLVTLVELAFKVVGR